MGNYISGVEAELDESIKKLPRKPKEMPSKQTRKSIDTLRKEARKELGIDTVTNYNFACCGGSGSGKSSMINGIRKMSDSDCFSAAVGEVETTKVISRYPYPGYAHVVLWDIPGGGTSEHRQAEYFYKKKLYAFDCLILVTGGRFLELDLQIIRDAANCGTPVILVRSKADNDIHSKVRRDRVTEQEAKEILRADTVASVQTQVAKLGISVGTRLFIVSSWSFTDPQAVQMDERHLVNFVLKEALARRNS